MKKVYLNGDQLNELIEKTQAEIVDGYDGCLLDNGLYYSETMTFAVYEHYLNCWCSDYEVKIATTEEDIEKVTNEFFENMAKMEVEDDD